MAWHGADDEGVGCVNGTGNQVACLDYVTPTPQGTRWGLGGTCVNVGCIPKKLMHQAGIIGEIFSDAREFGWKLPQDVQLEWEQMVGGIQDYIGSLNWGYRVALRDNKVEYINALGKFVDAHTMECTKKNGSKVTITADKFVVAVGGRPRYPDLEGARELCITSDDVFSLPSPPGKTLCVGASYISLETAGFLTALKFDVTVMVRSILLRGFDQEIAEQIGGYMERHGTRFIHETVPTKFEKVADKIMVHWKNLKTGIEGQEEFDTVLLALGRDAITKDLGLENAGVEIDRSTGKIPATNEQTNVANIFAIGDVLESRQELTPVAIKAGELLSARLFGGATKQMDYNQVPTTVFTPLEYGCVGLSEEEAIAKYGEENLEVYISYYKPLEWCTNHEEHNGVQVREDSACYAKLITHLPDNERVIGLHVLGPNAGEVTQGFAVAIKCGATKEDFDTTVGIHPTTAEEFTTLKVTKRSGVDARKKGC